MNKFNDYDSLEKSYAELEKQFTKKCQQTAELDRECRKLKEEYDALNTECAFLRDNAGGINAEASPPESAEEFFKRRPSAVNFRGEIERNVTAPGYGGCPDAYERCYLDVLEQAATAPREPDKDLLQQYALASPEICEAVLRKVFNGSEEVPRVICGGGNLSLAAPARPKTIKEASGLAKEYFK